MRIGIDLSLACRKFPRGIGVFEKNIGIPNSNFLKKHKVYVFGIGEKPSWIPRQVKYVNLYVTNPIIREQVLLPLLTLFFRIKELHVFANVAPLLLLKSSCKVITTIHDVSYKYPRDYMKIDKNQNTIKRWIGLIYHSILFDITCKYSEKIFTVSNWSSSEIIKYAKYKVHRKLHIIPNVCSNDFISKEKPEWSEKSNRILLVTGAHPQKNLKLFCECFIKLSSFITLDVVVDIVGVKGCEMEDRYSKFDGFTFHGMVPQSQLVDMYDRAKLLVMPSLHESFGIPLIEAKYRGLWILSSSGGASKEIVSNYATFFNPNDEDDLFRKLEHLLSNKIQHPTQHFNNKYHQEDINQLYWDYFYE